MDKMPGQESIRPIDQASTPSLLITLLSRLLRIKRVGPYYCRSLDNSLATPDAADYSGTGEHGKGAWLEAVFHGPIRVRACFPRAAASSATLDGLISPKWEGP